MARQEADREDLFAEAIALARRIEGRIDARTDLVILGFRPSGWLSVYLGPDLMYQFDDQGRLRRAFVSGCLYRSQRTTLACLVRQRTTSETILLRRDLQPDELSAFRRHLLASLAPVISALEQNSFVVRRQVPENDGALPGDLRDHLKLVESCADWLAPAMAPRR